MAQGLMSTELWVLLPLHHPNARSWPESGHTSLVMSVAKFHQEKMDVIWHVEEIFVSIGNSRGRPQGLEHSGQLV